MSETGKCRDGIAQVYTWGLFPPVPACVAVLCCEAATAALVGVLAPALGVPKRREEYRCGMVVVHSIHPPVRAG